MNCNDRRHPDALKQFQPSTEDPIGANVNLSRTSVSVERLSSFIARLPIMSEQ